MSAPAPTQRRILVVEGSPEDATLVHRLLGEQPEWKVEAAASGRAGLERCREMRPDCVLLDFNLPDMTAPEFLDALAASRALPPLPVVVLTTQEDTTGAAATLKRGAQDYLVIGTVSAHGLARVVENALEKFALVAELESQKNALELRNWELEALRDELNNNLNALAEASRAKDQFLAVMSHEMRTPLNAILGYAELFDLGAGAPLSEDQRAYLERIRLGGRHLLDLINDVLDLARADARKLELDLRPVDLGAVTEEVTALLETQAATKGLELRIEPCDEPLPYVRADLQRLRQILTNLVGNAIKFTERGSVVLRCARQGDVMHVRVEDTGIGIAPEVLPRVFAEFYQAHGELTRTQGGSGLGLAIARRLAQLMGGDVLAESTPGVGSVFTVVIPIETEELPLRDEDVAGHQQRMSEYGRTQPPEREEASVVVVAYGADEGALRELERRVFPGVRLAWTARVEDVPRLARAERPALVVLDIGSTDGVAWNTAHALREIPEMASTAVLLLPGIPPAAPSEDAPGGLDLGWVSLVPKPFTQEQLTGAIRSVAGAHGNQEERPYEVLVVDDDADSRRVAAQYLAAVHATVREAADGETALADMRRRPPDVAVLDLMMPVLDGFGVLAAMRADPRLYAIPVVVLSAKTLNQAERQFLARTAVRVLQKGDHRLADVAALVLRAASQANPALPDPPAPAAVATG